MKRHILFPRKNKKHITNVSSAELAQIVFKVNYMYTKHYPFFINMQKIQNAIPILRQCLSLLQYFAKNGLYRISRFIP